MSWKCKSKRSYREVIVLMYFFIPVEGNPAFAVPDICIADVVEENIYLQQKRYTIINCIVNYLLDIRF